MGPRPFGRGDHRSTGFCVSLAGFNGAAAFRPRRRERRFVVKRNWQLQWGRGLSAAETATDSPERGPPTNCFNGAAAFRPRRQSTSGSDARKQPGFNGAAAFRPRRRDRCGATAQDDKLQWGRGLSAAETRWCWPIVAGSNASMGPRPFGRGDVANGVSKSVVAVASMGPRPFGRGDPHALPPAPQCRAASMGPRPFGRGDPE